MNKLVKIFNQNYTNEFVRTTVLMYGFNYINITKNCKELR